MDSEDPPKQARVQRIPLANIRPNPHNPRRLFDEEPMKVLKESISKLGVLVPVTVYPQKRGPIRDVVRDRFVLLDGERRWRCACELDLLNLPAIIVEQPTEVENILTMFHIHNVREGWQLMPTALKLRTLMETLEETNERKLAELTKLSVGQVRRCKILLTYPRRFQNMMLAPTSERMKTDFFIELNRVRGPALSEKFPPWKKRGDSKCIQIVLDKYLKETIKAVTDFRKLAELYRGCVRTNRLGKFHTELDRFLTKPDMGIDDLRVPGVTFVKEVKEIKRSARRLLAQIRAIDWEALIADQEAINSLRRIMKTIQAKLAEALVTEPRDATTSEN